MMQSFKAHYAWFVVSVGMIATAVGCSDTPPPRQGPTATSSSASGSSSSGETGGMGGMGGTAGTGAAGGNPTGGMGGAGAMGGGGSGGTGGQIEELPVVDVADSACSDLVGTSTVLYADMSGGPAFDRLSVVNGRRLAGGRFAQGFITFNMDGTGKSPAVVKFDPELDITASEGNTIGLVTDDLLTIRFQRYGSNDTPIGGPIEVSNVTGAGWAIAGDGNGGSLVVWGSDDGLMNGRFIDAAGVAGTAYTFGFVASTQSMLSSLARRQQEFAVAWNSVETPFSRIRFARLSTTGMLGSMLTLPSTLEKNSVVKLVGTSTGYALLLQSGQVAFESIVVILDANGNVVGSARRFLGTQFATDLAVNGTNLAMVAKRTDGRMAIRPLDAQGAPIGDWRCLDGPSDGTYDLAGIDADGAGWAIVYRTPGSGEKFVRTNLTGTAAP